MRASAWTRPTSTCVDAAAPGKDARTEARRERRETKDFRGCLAARMAAGFDGLLAYLVGQRTSRPPAFFQASMPPWMWQAELSPASCAACTAIAERSPKAQ